MLADPLHILSHTKWALCPMHTNQPVHQLFLQCTVQTIGPALHTRPSRCTRCKGQQDDVSGSGLLPVSADKQVSITPNQIAVPACCACADMARFACTCWARHTPGAVDLNALAVSVDYICRVLHCAEYAHSIPTKHAASWHVVMKLRAC